MTEAKKKLDEMNLTEEERVAYIAYLKNLRNISSEQHTKMADAKVLIDKGRDGREKEAVIGFYENGIPIFTIANSLKISEDRVRQILEEEKKKKGNGRQS